jgi:hypothetical protein
MLLSDSGGRRFATLWSLRIIPNGAKQSSAA